MKRALLQFLLTVLLFASVASVASVANASHLHPAPSGWIPQTIDNQITFAYPSSFTPANDGSPGVQIAGGALLDSSKMNYALLLGVEINQTPHITVQSESARLIHNYGKANLYSITSSPLGQKLVFHLPKNITYIAILSLLPLNHGLREILINNENSSHKYASIIQTFLSTIHNIG